VTTPDRRTPHCYVINLRRRPDRREMMTSSLPSVLPVSFTSDWHGPFDGRRLTTQGLTTSGCELFPWQIDSSNPWWSRPLKYGEIGCALSHLRCWQDIVQTGTSTAIILEDDVVLPPWFLPRLVGEMPAALPHCDLLYLGRVPQAPDRGRVDGFAVPGYSHCTYGYVLTQHAAQHLVAAGLDKALIPVDEFLPAMYINHPRDDVRSCFPPRLRALAFEPALVHQLPKHVAGSDTEDSEFVSERPSVG
jgi:collagen beta-1,O-galactosyltransferase